MNDFAVRTFVVHPDPLRTGTINMPWRAFEAMAQKATEDIVCIGKEEDKSLGIYSYAVLHDDELPEETGIHGHSRGMLFHGTLLIVRFSGNQLHGLLEHDDDYLKNHLETIWRPNEPEPKLVMGSIWPKSRSQARHPYRS